MFKPRMTGLTYAQCSNLIIEMKLQGKTESTLGVICPNENDSILMKYLGIFDSLGATATYKTLRTKKNKFGGYQFTVKL